MAELTDEMGWRHVEITHDGKRLGHIEPLPDNPKRKLVSCRITQRHKAKAAMAAARRKKPANARNA